MSRPVKIIILIVVGLLVIAGIIVAFVFLNKPAAVVNGNENVNAANAGSLNTNGGRLIINDNSKTTITKDNAPALDEEQKTEINLERVALSFAERFGSYSNQSDFENFKDLQPLMTASMKDWSNKFIADNSKGDSKVYSGITTRALAVKSSDIKDDGATLVITTQRRETTADINNYKVYNQDLKLVFKNISGSWLVDAAYWQ